MIDHWKYKQPREAEFISQCLPVKTLAKCELCLGYAWFPGVIGCQSVAALCRRSHLVFAMIFFDLKSETLTWAKLKSAAFVFVSPSTHRYYSATILQMSGVEDDRLAIWLAALTAFINFIFTLVGVWLVERMGRRKLTLGSLTGECLISVLYFPPNY